MQMGKSQTCEFISDSRTPAVYVPKKFKSIRVFYREIILNDSILAIFRLDHFSVANFALVVFINYYVYIDSV